jgi:predicted HTH transcriptional regulator
MSQLSLFDQHPIVRPSDPQTSQLAAANIEPKLTDRQAAFVACLKLMGHPSTAQEIAQMARPEIRESVRKRAAECVRRGFVKQVGERKCAVTGNVASTYWIA